MKKISLLILLSLLPGSAFADEALSFEQIWSRIQKNAPEVQKENWQLKAAEVQKTQSQMHWIPKAYVNAKSYQTDEPGQVLFSKLSQRSVDLATDFSTATALNEPDTFRSTQVSVGVQWPLYQGGMGLNGQKSAHLMNEAQKLVVRSSELSVYAQALQAYGGLLNVEDFRRDVAPLLKEVEGQIKRYEVGGKRNPVGYSGLLGLKSVRNKILAYLDQAEVLEKKYRSQLEILASDLPTNWQVSPGEAVTLIDDKVGELSRDMVAAKSLQIQARQEMNKAMDHQIEMQEAKWQPHLGLFAEKSLVFGERDDAESTTMGAYLSWDLSPGNWGTSRNVKYQKSKEEAETRRLQGQEVVEKSSGWEALQKLKVNLMRMRENNQMLQEQVRISEKLYRNGAINAIQLSGLYSNRVEARKHLGDTIEQYIFVKSRLREFTGMPIETAGGQQ